MQKQLASLAALATLLILPGCVSVTPGAVDPIAPAAPGFEALAPGLNVRVLDDRVVAATVVSQGNPGVADYILQRPNQPGFLYHVESANPGQSFPLEVDRHRFYRGTYTLKVFLDKASTPTHIQTFEIP